MSSAVKPVPVNVVADDRPTEVVIISHSPLFYWWPVWAVGFLMAAWSLWRGQQVAFVPRGTTAERGAVVQGHDDPRDVLIVPEGRSLPVSSATDELAQPRLRMAESNNPGVLWALTLCLVLVVTHIQLRGVWSLLAVLGLGMIAVLFAMLGLWDPILRAIGFVDIHMNAFGYFSISLFVFVIWLAMFLVFDRLKYMIFTRGRLRVRKTIGDGEKVFDVRGMVFERHRDDLFRHWLLGFGTADLTVYTAGANAQQIEMPNVFGIGRKLALINTMLQEIEVTKAR
jgi:hypothetical protein